MHKNDLSDFFLIVCVTLPFHIVPRYLTSYGLIKGNGISVKIRIIEREDFQYPTHFRAISFQVPPFWAVFTIAIERAFFSTFYYVLQDETILFFVNPWQRRRPQKNLPKRLGTRAFLRARVRRIAL